MEGIEMRDYINERPRYRERSSGDTNQAARRLCRLAFLSFGVLCIIQAALNLSLRLASYPSEDSTHGNCNTTYFKDRDKKRPDQCNKLQERFNALTRDRDMLENRNSVLNNKIMALEEDKERLKMSLGELTGGTSCQRCPPQWREINCRCYFLSTETKTWMDSRKDCQDKGADLVVINNEQEEKALYRLNGDQWLLFWIGLHGTDGTFRWVDGSPLTEAFWQDGQPDHGGPNNVEDCVERYQEFRMLRTWNDAPCGHKRRWLCEKDPRS